MKKKFKINNPFNNVDLQKELFSWFQELIFKIRKEEQECSPVCNDYSENIY